MLDFGREKLSRTKEYKDGKVAAKAGRDYIAVECEEDPQEYFLFPEEPEHVFGTFRHSWALVRK